MNPPDRARRLPPHADPASAPQRAADEPRLAGQLGAEVASVLSSALERVRLLAQTGRIGRQSLAALQEELRQARQLAIVGQQVSRLAAGRVQQTPEVLELPQLLRDAMGQRSEEIAARGLEVKQRLQPAAVSVDPSLLFTLLVSLLDWAFEHCRGSTLQLSTGLNAWPVHAVLRCDFAWRAPDRVAPDAELALAAERADGPSALDTMAWRLVEQSARAMQVTIQRQDTAQRVHLALAFPEAPRRFPRLVDALTAMEDPYAITSRPLADSEVLLVSQRHDMRRLVHEATAGMGLALRVALDLAEAREMAQELPPHALIVDERNTEVDRFIGELKAGADGPALLHVNEAFQGLEISTSGRFEILRVARDEIVKELPAALAYALERSS
jgi:hypothetical protein